MAVLEGILFCVFKPDEWGKIPLTQGDAEAPDVKGNILAKCSEMSIRKQSCFSSVFLFNYSFFFFPHISMQKMY